MIIQLLRLHDSWNESPGPRLTVWMFRYMIHVYGEELLAHRPTLKQEDHTSYALRGRRFAADDEVQEAVHDWLHSQPQTFFSNGIKKLTDRWAKCIEKKWDYIEK